MHSILNKIIYHKHAKVILVSSAFILLFSVYKTYVWVNTQSTNNAYIDADISNVSSEISGVVSKVFVDENNLVKEGQIIAQLDVSDYKTKYEQSEANLDMSIRKIEVIEQNTKLAHLQQSKAIEAHEFAEESFKVAEVNYKRTIELSKDNFASKKNLDDTKIFYEKAKNDLSQSLLDLQIAKENVILLAIEKQVAIAQSNTALQERNLAKRALDNTNIRAPVDGIVGNSSLREGNFIRPGFVLFSIVPSNKFYVKANFKETQISNFKPGMKATIEIDSEPGSTIEGTIRNIAPATGSKFSLLPPANATGNFTKIVQRVPVIIDFAVPDELKNKIVPGMSTLTSIRIDQKVDSE